MLGGMNIGKHAKYPHYADIETTGVSNTSSTRNCYVKPEKFVGSWKIS
jgi:hypothetical protein